MRPFSASDLALLFRIATHELFHDEQNKFWKPGGEAEMAACPDPNDQDCIDDFRELIECHRMGDSPCVEVMAYTETFKVVCAKAMALDDEADFKEKNALLGEASRGCLKARDFVKDCEGLTEFCGPLPNPNSPPAPDLPEDCECPSQ